MRGGKGLQRTSCQAKWQTMPWAAPSPSELALAFLPLFARTPTPNPGPLACTTQIPALLPLQGQHY